MRVIAEHQILEMCCVCRSDMKALLLLLAHSSVDIVGSVLSPRDLRTPLHIACAMGNLAVAQLLVWVRNTSYSLTLHLKDIVQVFCSLLQGPVFNEL